jgi:eukaryotic-like serine/threonine-protein kinase
VSADVIAGRYHMERRLGIGGMSTVQQAFDPRLERRVAVKLLAEHLAEDSNFVARFRREALAAARLVHPNIVQVFDFGLDEPTGQHFIVMELVDGFSCAQLLRDHGTLPSDEVLDVVGQACRGLDHAHRHGVVHRDVKPGNLLRSSDGVMKLADFGIAKAAEQSSITQVGSVLGTAAYLAPEQARGEEAGPPADLYALGVVTYQLLSGRLPYEASSLSELALKQQREVPLPLDAVNPEVPPTLARAVARSLAIDANARYSDALAMAESLRTAARGLEPPAPEVEDAATEATSMMTSHEPAETTGATRVMPYRSTQAAAPSPMPPAAAEPERAPARARRRRARMRGLVATLIMLALLAGLVAVLAAESGTDRPKLRPFTAQDPQRAIEDVRDLINDNTR